MNTLKCCICLNEITDHRYYHKGCCGEGTICNSCMETIPPQEKCPTCRQSWIESEPESEPEPEPEPDFVPEIRFGSNQISQGVRVFHESEQEQQPEPQQNQTQINLTKELVDRVGYSEWMRDELQRRSDQMMMEHQICHVNIVQHVEVISINIVPRNSRQPLERINIYHNGQIDCTSMYTVILFLLGWKKRIDGRMNNQNFMYIDCVNLPRTELPDIYNKIKCIIGE